MKDCVFDPALHSFADAEVFVDHDRIGNLNPDMTGGNSVRAFGRHVIIENAFLSVKQVAGDRRLTPQQRVPYR